MPDSRDILTANLAALRQADPALAQRVEQATPTALHWCPSKAGPWSAAVEQGGRPMWLASRFEPVKEAQRLVGEIDYASTATVVVMGMGLGYHILEIANRSGRTAGANTLLVVFEPDVAMLRAVLEKVDHTSWLGRPNVIVVDEEVDRSAFMQRVEQYAGVVTQGTKLVVHPPTRQRAAEAIARFSEIVTDTIAFCRTSVATVLVNAARTCENLACNLGHYHAGLTIDPLHNAAKGYPAVCVAAGPSLARNVQWLCDPQVRQQVVVITVQTTLKTLLEYGIRPDYVTALDYAQISRQFYDNLPELPDVTLVAEPKAHADVLDAFPGPVRVLGNSFNDKMLGKLARPRMSLPSGATVAHLSFYLAQFLGCDPIIMIGQDLGFSNGLYYSPGAGTHQVWASELSPLNTLEMMEWTRVVRGKTTLRRFQDIHGQPIFSDEQMTTYLKQFERDFAKAQQTVIDATEGGMPKAHTTRMTLREALQQHATRDLPPLPHGTAKLDTTRMRQVVNLLSQRIREVQELKMLSQRTVPILKQILEHQRDRQQVNKLFTQLDKQRKRIDADLKDAFQLVNTLNTVGAFRRARADRAIAVTSTTDDYARQAAQLERDIDNINWTMQACDEALRIFRMALERMQSQLQQATTPGPLLSSNV